MKNKVISLNAHRKKKDVKKVKRHTDDPAVDEFLSTAVKHIGPLFDDVKTRQYLSTYVEVARPDEHVSKVYRLRATLNMELKKQETSSAEYLRLELLLYLTEAYLFGKLQSIIKCVTAVVQISFTSDIDKIDDFIVDAEATYLLLKKLLPTQYNKLMSSWYDRNVHNR